ncbi:hypothetical protein N7495_003785 [Penicillium taxi]|uniref:uncharacterized protein n=1 Tax=Penicillium taxi TaxID=168475 RepID=UPI002545B3DC|nr:uncharacterized protein N7495_003785 [Penicillium taxi]KAJ5899041.1 hypothetical protein N7495_003785 [Penicillium taxi]
MAPSIMLRGLGAWDNKATTDYMPTNISLRIKVQTSELIYFTEALTKAITDSSERELKNYPKYTAPSIKRLQTCYLVM